jgi:hypothetical protein
MNHALTVLCPRRLLVCVAAALCSLAVLCAAANAQTIDCSVPLTHNLTLTGDATCAQLGALKIGANGIKINLNGHKFTTVFGPVISDTGHRHLTIENGSVTAQSASIVLTDSHGARLINVTAFGGPPAVELQGGSRNSVIGSTVTGGFGGSALTLTGERHDIIRHDTFSTSLVGAGHLSGLKLDAADGNLIAGNHLGAIAFSGANRNVVLHNDVEQSDSVFPPGINGTGNRNLILFNTTPAGAITLAGKRNLVFGNSVP